MTKKKLHLLLLSTFLIFTSNDAYSKNNEPIKEVNKAIEINVKAINTNEKLELENFKGKYIFLDFWATWCEPCIKSMPHLEEIEKTFQDKVKIISISDENESVIKNFLKNKSFNFSIAMDIDKKTNKSYPHSSIPFIVIIKPNMEILGAYYPEQLSLENVAKIVSNNDKDFSNNYNISSKNIELDKDNVLSYSYFSKGKKDDFSDMNVEMDDNQKPYKLSIFNMSIIDIYKSLYLQQFNNNTIINNIKNNNYNDSNVYSLTVKTPKGSNDNNFNDFFEKCINFFNLETGIKTNILEKLIDVKLLKIKDISKLTLSNSKNSNAKYKFNQSKATFDGENLKISTLISFINRNFDRHIIDETSFKDRFDIKFEWRANDFESLEKVLESKGFYFEKAQRKVKFLSLSD